jgi:hypothetical protein
LADYTDMVADRLDSAGRYLREQDASRMVSDAADLARRKPEWVLGGAFVLGLAVARFLKSSRPGRGGARGYRYDDGYSDAGGSRPDFDYAGGYGSRSQFGEDDLNAGPTGQNSVAIISTDPATTPAVTTPSVTTTATGNWAAGGTAGGSSLTDKPQADRPEVI